MKKRGGVGESQREREGGDMGEEKEDWTERHAI